MMQNPVLLFATFAVQLRIACMAALAIPTVQAISAVPENTALELMIPMGHRST